MYVMFNDLNAYENIYVNYLIVLNHMSNWISDNINSYVSIYYIHSIWIYSVN